MGVRVFISGISGNKEVIEGLFVQLRVVGTLDHHLGPSASSQRSKISYPDASGKTPVVTALIWLTAAVMTNRSNRWVYYYLCVANKAVNSVQPDKRISHRHCK